MRSSHGPREPRAQQAPERLAVHTVPLPAHSDLLSELPEPTALAWVRHGEGLAGWGETARITLPAGEDRFTAGEKSLRELFEDTAVHDEVGMPGTGPVAFGSFTFDPASDGSVLVVPATIVGRRDGRAWLTTIRPAGTRTSPRPAPGNGAPAGDGTAAYDGTAARDSTAAYDGTGAPLGSRAEIRWHDGGLPAPDWERAVATAVARIREGRLRKVVLARDVYATSPAGFDTRVLLRRLAASYPDCYTFACAGLIGATPELLIRRQDDSISSLVLAGTVARGRDAAEDARLGERLLSSAKDTEEHGYAVAGVHAALAPLCAALAVDAKPSLLQLANVQHLATAVTGTLTSHSQREHSVLALVAALHPTGAVCGTPTETAAELIRELEGMDRGRYAGPVGWVDASGNGEWGIALRCGEVEGRRARLFAGCGIVAGSDPAAELAEAQAKFRPMQSALEA